MKIPSEPIPVEQVDDCDINPIDEMIDSTPPPMILKFSKPTLDELSADFHQMEISLSPFEPKTTERIPIKGEHQTLRLETEQHLEFENVVIFRNCAAGSSSNQSIRAWRCRLCGTAICHIGNTPITKKDDIISTVREHCCQNKKHINVTFAQPRWIDLHSSGILQIHFDQLHSLA